ncbi:MAG: TlpA family protein disulfide reductase [Deltaproteobacteria bacterium]|nr:TlpA family protein disulfide reductase [Deltaproteobacteria bacterium]
MKTRGILLVSISILLFHACAAGNSSNIDESKAGQGGVWEERDFTLSDLKGKRVSLSDFSNSKAVLIDFWALWCDSCKSELPRLEDMVKSLDGKGFSLVTVNTDEASRSAEVRAYVKQRGYTFPVLLDPQTRVIRRFNPSMSLPFTVLLDHNGRIVKTFEGYEPGSEKTILDEIGKLIGTTSGPDDSRKAPESNP